MPSFGVKQPTISNRAPVTVYYAKPDAMKGSLVHSLQKCQPSILLGVPRVWEKVKDILAQRLKEV